MFAQPFRVRSFVYCQYLRHVYQVFFPFFPRAVWGQVGIVHLSLYSSSRWTGLEIILSFQPVFICLKQLLLETCFLLICWLFQQDSFFFSACHLNHGTSLSLVLVFSVVEVFSPPVPQMEARQMLLLHLHAWLLDVSVHLSEMFLLRAGQLSHVDTPMLSVQSLLVHLIWRISSPVITLVFHRAECCTSSFYSTVHIVIVSVHSFFFSSPSIAAVPQASKLVLRVLRCELQVVPISMSFPRLNLPALPSASAMAKVG